MTELPWLAEEIAVAAAGTPPTAASYGLAVYCGEQEDAFPDDDGPWGWVTVAGGLSLWGLRRALEMAYARGWSNCSVYAYRED